MSLAAVGVGVAGLQAYSQVRQGEAQAAQFKAQAQDAELKGRADAIAYKQRAADALTKLNETLASTTARASASGIDALSGSALSLQNYAISQGGLEYQAATDNSTIAEAMGRRQAQIYRTAGKNARTSGYLNAAASIGMGYVAYGQLKGSTLLNLKQTVPGAIPASSGGGAIGVPLNLNSTSRFA